MGNRASITFFNSDLQFSPTAFVHWHGSSVLEYLKYFKEDVGPREGDQSMACARFIGWLHENPLSGSELSLAVLNNDFEYEAFEDLDREDLRDRFENPIHRFEWIDDHLCHELGDMREDNGEFFVWCQGDWEVFHYTDVTFDDESKEFGFRRELLLEIKFPMTGKETIILPKYKDLYDRKEEQKSKRRSG